MKSGRMFTFKYVLAPIRGRSGLKILELKYSGLVLKTEFIEMINI